MFLNKQNTLWSASYKKHTIFPFLLHIHVSAANEKWFPFVLYKGTWPSFSEYFDKEGGYYYVSNQILKTEKVLEIRQRH